MTVALAVISIFLLAWTVAAFATGWQRLACALAFAAGITIGILSHMLGSAP